MNVPILGSQEGLDKLSAEGAKEGGQLSRCLLACYPHGQEDSQVTQGFQSVQRGRRTSEYQHMLTATKNLKPISAKKRNWSVKG